VVTQAVTIEPPLRGGFCVIVPLHFDCYRVARPKEAGVGRVNIELLALRASLTNALRWNILTTNPLFGLPLVAVPEKLPSSFTHKHLAAILEATGERWLKDVIVVGLLTGMRRGELLNLRWTDVDSERGLVKVHSGRSFRTKNRKSRVIQMNQVVRGC
jgi:integrase